MAPETVGGNVASIKVTAKGRPPKRVPVRCVAVTAISLSWYSMMASNPDPSGLYDKPTTRKPCSVSLFEIFFFLLLLPQSVFDNVSSVSRSIPWNENKVAERADELEQLLDHLFSHHRRQFRRLTRSCKERRQNVGRQGCSLAWRCMKACLYLHFCS